MNKKIVIVLASNQQNLILAKTIQEELIQQGAEIELIDLVALDLPMFTPDQEKKHGIPALIQGQLKILLSAHGFFVVSPEYNGGVPPVLTSWLAWVSRSSANWRDAFYGKGAALACHSGGGGAQVLPALRLQWSYLGVNVVGRPISVTADKPLQASTLRAVATQLLKLI